VLDGLAARSSHDPAASHSRRRQSQSSLRNQEVFVKHLTAFVAVTAALCLYPAASMAAVADGPTSSASSPVQQDLRAPDLVSPAAAPLQDMRAPDQAVSAGSLAPESVVVPDPAVASASTDVSATSGGGLGTLWIVLISLGGAVALSGVAYTTKRVVHGHGPTTS
jgi:hypothetical protein